MTLSMEAPIPAGRGDDYVNEDVVCGHVHAHPASDRSSPANRSISPLLSFWMWAFYSRVSS